MSLVGSLEDLDLGDILQIIHLSRKSGALQLQSSEGEGQILFCDGLIATAFRKGGPTDLGELLVARELVRPDALDAALDYARARAHPLAETLIARKLIDPEALELARRAHAEEIVLRMFGWPSGEFSFEVREITATEVGELFLDPGLNPQFLALEGTRQFDESEHELEVVFDGELDASSEEPTPALGETLEDPCDEPTLEPMLVDAPVEAASPPAPAAVAVPAEPAPPIVVIDPALPVLEWVKQTLQAADTRVHVFQTSELGISRIRQYLARRELPLVLIAADAPGDSLSGARDTAEIVRRLQAQAPRMQVLVMTDRHGEPAGESIPKPSASDLADPRAAERRQTLADAFRDALPFDASSSSGDLGSDAGSVEDLREVSARIRNPEAQGEVLGEVLRFAARSFRRVALFAVRDGVAVGLAQLGLETAGGPDEEAFRGIELSIADSPWLKTVVETRAAHCTAPAPPGDPELSARLGSRAPERAFLGPIESSGKVVAIVYGDILPSDGPLPSTATLEVVMDQAGLAMDRAALERVLDEG